MKLTQIKTNKQQQQTVKLLTIDKLMETLQNGSYSVEVERLREFTYFASEYSRFKNMHQLPVIYPSAELKTDEEGNHIMQHFNGTLTMTIGPLHEPEEAQAVKQAVAMLPSTVAALLGSSGKSVKVIVSIARADGSLPQTEDEAEQLCQRACPIVGRLYEVAVRMAPAGECLAIGPAIRQEDQRLLLTGFRMTNDPQPFFRPAALPLLIPEGLVPSMPTAPTTQESMESAVSESTRQLIQLLERNYAFRMNTVMGYVEYRSKTLWHYGWQPVDERVQNSLAMEARLAGMNIWDKDISRYLKSNHIRNYNPIEEYLWQLHGKWDGKDHIGRLAKTVPTDNKHWPNWFRTWFLAMVAQWTGKNRRYGNSIAPLLISRQGYNKSTFCKSLIPPELQWGYNDNLVLSEKKSVLQAMSQFLLINLDEFNQISPKVQEGFLKNLIQLASVKVKRPYGKHVEDFPRLASFIATANVTDILTDPTGNRRFIGIELTGPIDTTYRINYTQLYAQAVALLDQGEPYWLDEEQTRMVMESNQLFQLRSPEEMFFHDYFMIPAAPEDGQFMTTTAIFQHIRKQAGAAMRNSNIRAFGRMLAGLDGLIRRRARNGTEYLVRPVAK